MPEWQTGRPPGSGYYLGAWRRGDSWRVSELWFNPASTGSGWWASRGYLHDNTAAWTTVPVEAWMPIPAYEPEGGNDAE